MTTITRPYLHIHDEDIQTFKMMSTYAIPGTIELFTMAATRRAMMPTVDIMACKICNLDTPDYHNSTGQIVYENIAWDDTPYYRTQFTAENIEYRVVTHESGRSLVVVKNQ